MKEIRLCLAGIFFCAVVSSANAAEPEVKQKIILCKGVVLDGETGLPISGVALYTGHTNSEVTTRFPPTKNDRRDGRF